MDGNLRSRTRSSGAGAGARYSKAGFGSPELSPSEEDYREIFGGFHGARGASAIPVLDLPPVEDEAMFDFRLFDYSEVFGGFRGMDYVAPFQKLFPRRSNGGDASSSDDAWTHVEMECLSEEWDRSPNSLKCKSFGNESKTQCVDDGKQFHLSYERKHQMNDDGVSNTAHVDPVRAVPGYSYVIDQGTPSQKIELRNPQLHVDGDDKLIKTGKREEELLEKPTSYSATVDLKKGHVQDGPDSDEMYVTISEINLRTNPSGVLPPSRPPPISNARYGDSSEATTPIRATCNSKFFYGITSGNDSPPFVDVEVDARFSAAEGTASETESLKNCQPKLKTSEDDLQNKNIVMSQVNGCPKDEADRFVVVCETRSSHEDQKDDPCSVQYYVQKSSRKESKSGLNCAQSLPDVMGHNPMLNLTGKKKIKQPWSSDESCEARPSGEWSKVPEFIELVPPGKTKTTKQEIEDDIIVQNWIIKRVKEEKWVPEQEEKINVRICVMTNISEDRTKISEATSKVTYQDDYYREVHVSFPVGHQCVGVGRKSVEENLQIEDDISINILQNELEIEKFRGKVNLDEERMENPRYIPDVGLVESFVGAEGGGRVTDDVLLNGPGEMNMNLREVGKETHMEQHNERVVKSNIDQERQKPCFKEAVEGEEIIKEEKKSPKGSPILEETKGSSSEIFEEEENERRRKEEEYVAKLMEASENEAEEMLKEALEKVSKRILMEDFERIETKNRVKNEAEAPHNQKVQLSEENLIDSGEEMSKVQLKSSQL